MCLLMHYSLAALTAQMDQCWFHRAEPKRVHGEIVCVLTDQFFLTLRLFAPCRQLSQKSSLALGDSIVFPTPDHG